jgi:2-keto-3-deoxy-L-arabinonate dehydratase
MTSAVSKLRTAPVLDGIIAVPATPFTADNRVDVESLRRYARSFLARGVIGFLAPAVAGEVDTLSEEERELVVATLLEEVDGRVPVIGGATALDPADRLRHAHRFLAMGCAGVLAYVRYADEAGYAAAVHELGALNPGFLMIQDLDLGVAPLPVPLIARLHREIPVFTWVKLETADRGRKLTALREAAGSDLRIGTAGPDLIEMLDRGAHAYLPTLYPDTYARIWSLHRAGRRDDAIALYRRLLPGLAFMATHQKIQWRFTKSVLHAEGIFATTRVRTAAPPLDAFEERLIAELARDAVALAGLLP